LLYPPKDPQYFRGRIYKEKGNELLNIEDEPAKIINAENRGA
jgi:hypothetical protein